MALRPETELAAAWARKWKQDRDAEQSTRSVRDLVWKPNPGPQTALLMCPVQDVFFGGSRGGGKGLLSRSGVVLTPFGFKSIAKVKVGDSVCAVDGTVTHVIGVYPRGKQPAYRCHFSDGTSIEVDGDHIWQGWRVNQITKKGNRRTSGEGALRNYSMQELLGFVGTERNRGAYATNRFAIPLPGPVAYNVAGQLAGRGNFISRTAVHPYVLGVILGDGSIVDKHVVKITSADIDIVDRVASLLGPGEKLCPPQGKKGSPASTWTISSRPIKAMLKVFGLTGKYSYEKHIPRIYKMGSVEERWELLRGLMDTDGWVEEDQDIYFTSTSRALASDLREVAWSLGAIVTWREKIPIFTHLGEKKQGRRAYTLRLKFKDNAMAFHLERKKEIAANKEYQNLARYMERIEHIGEEASICIAVAHSSSLFIANNFLVTHNSTGLLGDFLQHAKRYGIEARGMIFRRTYPELEEIIDLSNKMYLPIGAKYLRGSYDWEFPNGAVLRLRHLETASDAAGYMGRSMSYQGFDELPNWPDLKVVDLLWGSLRSAAGVPCVRRCTGNPGGPGHAAVKERYRLGAGERCPFVPFDYSPNKERPDMKIQAVFIPSLLEDNPYLFKNDPGYEERLFAVGDPALARAWRFGDWDVVAGRYFEDWNADEYPAGHVYDPAKVELQPWYPRNIAIDFGFVHNAAVHWSAWDGTRVHVYRSLVVNEVEPLELGRMIAKENENERIADIFLSPDSFGRRQSLRTLADEIADGLSEGGLSRPIPADNERVAGWRLIGQMFKSKTLLISRKCTSLIEKIPLLMHNPKNLEDALKVEGDDEMDALRYLVKTRPAAVSEPVEEKIRRFVKSEDPTMRALQHQLAERKFRGTSGAGVKILTAQQRVGRKKR